MLVRIKKGQRKWNTNKQCKSIKKTILQNSLIIQFTAPELSIRDVKKSTLVTLEYCDFCIYLSLLVGYTRLFSHKRTAKHIDEASSQYSTLRSHKSCICMYLSLSLNPWNDLASVWICIQPHLFGRGHAVSKEVSCQLLLIQQDNAAIEITG